MDLREAIDALAAAAAELNSDTTTLAFGDDAAAPAHLLLYVRDDAEKVRLILELLRSWDR
jgi:hypothetical protein